MAEVASEDKLFLDHFSTVVQTTNNMASGLPNRTGMGRAGAPVSSSPPATTVSSLIFIDGDGDNDLARAAIVIVVLASQST